MCLFCLLFKGADKSMCFVTFPKRYMLRDDRISGAEDTLYGDFIYFLLGVYEIVSPFDFLINFWLYFVPTLSPI